MVVHVRRDRPGREAGRGVGSSFSYGSGVGELWGLEEILLEADQTVELALMADSEGILPITRASGRR